MKKVILLLGVCAGIRVDNPAPPAATVTATNTTANTTTNIKANASGNATAKAEPVPVILFGGMGSKCNDPAYTNLVAKLKDGLKTHVECYETTIMDSINKQHDNACEFLKKNDNYNKAKEINVI